MSKIEKTLELNITHEILSLADSFWWHLQATSLRDRWEPHWRFPLLDFPRSFATGLHINLEGKKGGGYDVCIHSPSNFQGGNPRLLFMQFKAGSEQKFSSDNRSLFYGDDLNPSVHVAFEINSNKKKNQHRLLKELAAKAGNKDAVVYVFPRIVNEDQLRQNIGSLLTKTSFISIEEMDIKAAAHGVAIDDKNSHAFRTCYNDFHKNEVNYYYYFFGRPKSPGGLLGEIFAIRMYRALRMLKRVVTRNAPLPRYPKYYIIDAMIDHVLNLAKYFLISPSYVRAFFQRFPDFINRLSGHNLDYELGGDTKLNENPYLSEIFEDIMQSLTIYFKWIEESDVFSRNIPTPPEQHTLEVKEDMIRIAMDSNEEHEDLNEITYSFF